MRRVREAVLFGRDRSIFAGPVAAAPAQRTVTFRLGWNHRFDHVIAQYAANSATTTTTHSIDFAG